MRQKVRIRMIEKAHILQSAVEIAKENAEQAVVPQFRRFVNGLSIKERLIIAWRIMRGKY